MSVQGWKRLLQGRPWFRGEGSFPFPAYSEFMPPPRLGQHTREVLREAGIADAEVDALAASGAVVCG